MEKKPVFEEPFDVDAVDGIVVITGPEELNVRLTADSAEESSRRLLTGAMKARGQIYFRGDRES